MLRIWDTKKRSIEEVRPLQPGKVGFYACGPTVYQRAHIGNLRAYVFEDVLKRALMANGYSVRHVVNITDVGHLTDDADAGEDKMERAAKEEGKDAWDISREYTRLFLEDIAALNILLPDALPKATDHIDEQIELVKTLEDKGFTYETDDGVYFDTSKFTHYGSLGGQSLSEKQEGVRVEANTQKRHPSDFALWKFSGEKGKRHMEWDSPWGKGFPGWHAECSAMSRKELGQPFDIHAGGIDHIPVHHENEIAQSEAAYGVPLANMWFHVEFLLIEGQKMSKSLRNTFTIDDLREHDIYPLAFRYFLLGSHYRKKQNFTWDAVQGAQIALEKMYRVCRAFPNPGTVLVDAESAFMDAINDDLNTPEALASLHALFDGDQNDADKAATALAMDRVLGLGLDAVVSKPLFIPPDIKALADERDKARNKKQWDRSDALRDEIERKGWILRDTAEGYLLERASIDRRS